MRLRTSEIHKVIESQGFYSMVSCFGCVALLHHFFVFHVAVVTLATGQASSSTSETEQLVMEPRCFVGHFRPSQLKMLRKLRVLQSIVFEDLERVTWSDRQSDSDSAYSVFMVGDQSLQAVSWRCPMNWQSPI